MKKITKVFYKCDFCNDEFISKKECENHEKKNHLCFECKHSFLLFGSELTCDIDNKCHFEPKDNK